MTYPAAISRGPLRVQAPACWVMTHTRQAWLWQHLLPCETLTGGFWARKTINKAYYWKKKACTLIHGSLLVSRASFGCYRESCWTLDAGGLAPQDMTPAAGRPLKLEIGERKAEVPCKQLAMSWTVLLSCDGLSQCHGVKVVGHGPCLHGQLRFCTMYLGSSI